MRRHFFIIIVILFIVLIAGGFFFWRPKLQKYLALKTELEIKKTEAARKKDYFDKLKVVSDNLEKHPEALDKIDSALPEDLSIPALFDFIEKTSAENGLILEGLSLEGNLGSGSESAAGKISLSLSASGSYAAFKNFLSALYRSARMIEVNSISFSAPKENDFFSFKLSLTTYFYSKKSALKPSEKEEAETSQSKER